VEPSGRAGHQWVGPVLGVGVLVAPGVGAGAGAVVMAGVGVIVTRGVGVTMAAADAR
jgi:hypothetical protein